jgi:hypothetical protein
LKRKKDKEKEKKKRKEGDLTNKVDSLFAC